MKKTLHLCIWVFPKNRGSPEWMVYIGLKWKNPIKMDDLGIRLFLETPIWQYYLIS